MKEVCSYKEECSDEYCRHYGPHYFMTNYCECSDCIQQGIKVGCISLIEFERKEKLKKIEKSK